jgi:hypothetical protein
MSIVFTLLLSINSMACDELKIVCKTVCQQDGDELGLVIDNKCYCANQRDVSKLVTKVPKNGQVIQNKVSFW